jgi:RNA-directed DNA polymerase
MKDSNVKGLANRDGPESCVEWSNPPGEALTGERAGWVLSREMINVRDADPVRRRGRPQPMFRFGKGHWYPARSETPGMYGNNLRENREILRLPRQLCLGRIVKSKDVRR